MTNRTNWGEEEVRTEMVAPGLEDSFPKLETKKVSALDREGVDHSAVVENLLL